MELETCGNSKKVQLWFWGPILKYRMYSTKDSNVSCIKKSGERLCTWQVPKSLLFFELPTGSRSSGESSSSASKSSC